MIVRMAFRNILRHKRRSFFSGLAMGLGFAMFSFSIAMSQGGYWHIINMFTRESVGHIKIQKKDYLDNPSLYKTVDDIKFVNAILDEEEKIQSYTPRINSGALAFHKKKSIGAQIIGVDPQTEEKTTTIFNKLVEGRKLNKSGNEVLIDKGIANVLKMKLDDELVLIAQGADGSIANDIYKVVGIIDSEGSPLGQHLVLMPLQTSQEFLVLYGRVHEIVVVLSDHEKARKTVKKILPKFSKELEIHPWEVVQKDFYKAMKADKNGSYFFLFIIMLVVGIGVFNTVLMSILERTKEYGLLKAIGTRPFDIFKLIVWETVILTLISVIPGTVLALGANWYFSVYGMSFDPPITYGGITIAAFKSIITPETLWVPALVVVFTAILVSIFPAIKAARTVPNEALREM